MSNETKYLPQKEYKRVPVNDLVDWIEKQGLTQEQAGEKLGRVNSCISNWISAGEMPYDAWLAVRYYMVIDGQASRKAILVTGRAEDIDAVEFLVERLKVQVQINPIEL